MGIKDAGDILIEQVNRALWSLALDSWHAFGDDYSDDDRTATLSPFVLDCAGAIGQAFVDAEARQSREAGK